MAMKIAVIGPGSMGLLFGGKLSAAADVILIGRGGKNLNEIAAKGITIRRGDQEMTAKIPVYAGGEAPEPVDLVILFTKAYQIREALRTNTSLIGPETMLLTLQNGAGHEQVMQEIVPAERVLIGTTKQGSYRESASVIVNSGLGETVIGSAAGSSQVSPETARRMEEIREVFEKAGLPCILSENVRFEVWNKLMINASSSVLSGVLQVRQGYVAENPHAWAICQDLIREICLAAAGEGCAFDAEEQIRRIHAHLEAAPDGYTSIYADLKNGRKTEADYICGAVVRAARAQGIQVPTQETVLRLVHAMEERAEGEKTA